MKGFPGGGEINTGGTFVLHQVTLFEAPDFAGRSLTLGVGQHRFFTPDDFNDLASSIRVPAGLVAMLFEHADEGGGYGRWVDLLEDCPNLAVYDFAKIVSYVDVFSAATADGHVWARGIMQDGTFVPGHWVRRRASGELPPNPGVAVVGPPLPSRAPPPQTTILVQGTTSVITTLGSQAAPESGFWERVVSDIMSLEWNGSVHTAGQPDCDDPDSVREADFVEAEIQASSDLNSGVNELLRDTIAAAGDRKIGVYGAWIYDQGHCCHSEIHPAEQLWWREDLADRSIYHCAVVCDASGRFWLA